MSFSTLRATPSEKRRAADRFEQLANELGGYYADALLLDATRLRLAADRETERYTS